MGRSTNWRGRTVIVSTVIGGSFLSARQYHAAYVMDVSPAVMQWNHVISGLIFALGLGFLGMVAASGWGARRWHAIVSGGVLAAAGGTALGVPLWQMLLGAGLTLVVCFFVADSDNGNAAPHSSNG